MMDIEQALSAVLAANAGLAALVGDRIYPEQAPQSGILPSVIYYQASRRQVRNLAGERINLNSYVAALEVNARTYLSAKQVYLALREAILDLRGPIADGTIRILGLFEEDGNDRHTPPIHADAKGVFHADLEVTIGYTN